MQGRTGEGGFWGGAVLGGGGGGDTAAGFTAPGLAIRASDLTRTAGAADFTAAGLAAVLASLDFLLSSRVALPAGEGDGGVGNIAVGTSITAPVQMPLSPIVLSACSFTAEPGPQRNSPRTALTLDAKSEKMSHVHSI